MDKNKIIVGAGIVAVLALVFVGFRFVTQEETIQPEFAELLIAQDAIVEISGHAARNGRTPEMRNRASLIASTVGSSYAQLEPYYENEFGRVPRSTEKDVIDEVRDTNEGYDELYREYVLEYLRLGRSHIELISSQVTDEEFLKRLDVAQQTHQTHIDALTR